MILINLTGLRVYCVSYTSGMHTNMNDHSCATNQAQVSLGVSVIESLHQVARGRGPLYFTPRMEEEEAGAEL